MAQINAPLYYAKASIETMMRKFEAGMLPPVGRFHYHQGVFLSGVYNTYKLCGDKRYYDYVKAWVDSCIDNDGNLKESKTGQLDDQMAGILLFPLYKDTKDAKYKKVLDTVTDVIKNFPRNEVGGFWHKDVYPNQMWLDGLYMAGPLCCEYGKTFNKPEFIDMSIEQALLMRKYTEDKKTGLYYHAWDCSKMAAWCDKNTGLSPEFWGRSVGWVVIAVLNELDFIDESHEKYGELCAIVKDLLLALIKYQSKDGRWYQVIDKGEDESNWLENSCSCLYTAGICKAVRKGILDKKYLEYAKKGYEGVINSLSFEGEDLIVGNVCVGTGVGNFAHYCARPTSANDLHGVGAFLIMCTEAEGLL